MRLRKFSSPKHKRCSVYCYQLAVLLKDRSYLGAAEEEKEREGSVGMGCIFELHIPDLRYIAFSVIFLPQL